MSKIRKVCYLDLDGVFLSYPRCWLDYIKLRTGESFDSLEDAKKSLSYRDYTQIKKDYRNSDYKYNLKPKSGSSSFTDFLHNEGYFIVIATTRPSRHLRLPIRTIRWLDQNSISFDDIIFCDDKAEVVSKYPGFEFGVEDEVVEANKIARLGYRMFLINDLRNDQSELHSNITVVNGFKDIMSCIKNEESQDKNIHSKPKHP